MADGSVFLEGDSVLSRSSPVLSSELDLLSSMSAAFSDTDAASALEVCRGKNRRGNRRRKREFSKGQRDELKGVHEKMDKTLKEDRMKVIGSGIKKDSLHALTVSCYLAPRSPCPQRCTRETLSSLQSRINNKSNFLFIKNFSQT